MVKKILLGGLFIGIVGILIVGAINRTNVQTASATGGKHLYSNVVHEDDREHIYSGGNGVGRGSGNAAVPASWYSAQGRITAINGDEMRVATTDGEVLVEGQPWQYALGQGFIAQVGDEMKLSGYDEDDEFKVGWLENLSTGYGVMLRDETGRPGWAGRSRITS